MQKDVIYIDVEDDITAIISKVKESKQKIVALVPPKRVGAIQSAVNLKLVHRAAEQANKRLVIISNNVALMALAGSAGIPVAKNLQSRPEMAEIPALEVDDGEDVIDGAELPGSKPAEAGASPDTASAPEKREAKPSDRTKSALGAAAVAAKDKVKIPNFDSFRKKLFLGIGGAIVLIGFLVWAIVFAPSAHVTVTARASDAALTSQVRLLDGASTDFKEGMIKSVVTTTKKDVSKPFTATGKKDVGEKASGAATAYVSDAAELDIYRNNTTYTMPAGTALTAKNGQTYVTATTVSFGPDNIRSTGGKASIRVTASASGAASNGATGALSGAPRGFNVRLTSETAGGTDKTVTVVQQSDVDAVSGDIVSQSDSDAAKKELTAQLGSDYVVIDSSFKTDAGEVKPSPAVGGEVGDGKATLSGSVSFSIVAIQKSEIGKFLDAYYAQQIDGRSNQKVYDNGLKGVAFTNVTPTEGGFKATITANGKIGPQIDENALKEYARGKRFGEIQDHIKKINGVENVDVKLAPFWVSSVPNDVKKIQVEFKVNN